MARKILMIEDDPNFSETIGDIFEMEGYKMVTAADGSEGLRKAREDEPDLLILDIMLPDMDGFEVCHHLRADPKTAHLPIIMLTAKTLLREQKLGFETGADDYLTKPVDPSELMASVKALLFFADCAKSEMDEDQGILDSILASAKEVSHVPG